MPTCHRCGRGDGAGGGTMREGGRSACAGPAAPAIAPTAAVCGPCAFEGRDSVAVSVNHRSALGFAQTSSAFRVCACDLPAIDPPQARLSRLLTPALAPAPSSPRCRASRRTSPRPRALAALLLDPVDGAAGERKAAASCASRRPRTRSRSSSGKCRGSRPRAGYAGGGMTAATACVLGEAKNWNDKNTRLAGLDR